MAVRAHSVKAGCPVPSARDTILSMSKGTRLLVPGSLVLVTAVIAACGGAVHDVAVVDQEGDGGAASADGGVVTSSDAASAADATATSSGVYSLATCTTNIAADVPAFYKKFFRCVTVTKTATGVDITWNGLPPHPSYYWGQGSPNFAPFDTSRGADYHPNPNLLSGRAHTMSVPDAPVSRNLTVTSGMVDHTANTNAAEYRGGPVGVGLDSVPLFNDQAAPGDDIAKERFTFDSYEAHPTQNGDYHYHTASPGPLEALLSAGLTTSRVPGAGGFELYGMMCDGTVVLGCTELDGTKPDTLGADAQNGHVTDMKDSSGTLHFASRYHVHVCPTLFTSHVYTPEIQFYGACAVR